MPSETFELFSQAVEGRKQIVCTYQGRRREICPHVVGWKEGREQALSFQFAGQSSKGLPPGGEWRCLILSQVRDVEIRDGDWHTGHGHLRPQTCVNHIFAEVTY